jgi:hypothetical protein
MALQVADRVWEYTSTTGTGTLTLAGAVPGYQSFAAIGNGNQTYYTILNGSIWEVGIGTYTSSGTTLSRDTVLSNSSGNTSPITLVGSSSVFCDYPAEKAVIVDASGNTYAPNIGGTTPAAGTFTTITGQTEVLKGTGENLVINSQVFTSGWNLNNLSATSNSTTAPDSTNTGSTLTASAGTSILHQAYQGTYAYLTTSSVTFSIYAKAGTNNFLAISVGNANGFYANFNVSNGTVGQSAALGTGTLTSATATSVGNGWYRLVIIGKTVDAPYALFSMSNAATYSADGLGRQTWTSAGTETVFIWGAQFEYGTAVSAYQVTTSALVFNQPSLSFNNAAQIGMEYNGNLYLQPNGTGALQAQATTSTATGGNARGANAVDWQTSRNSATYVASGSQSTVSGGAGNRATSTYATASGGNNNASSGYGSYNGGGNTNISSGSYSFVGAGESNTASNYPSAVVAGSYNTSAGLFNFIGGGFTNSGTASAAVTTQSGTMNGTTAVTLSGSNASIKVGQYISGTSIAGDTYVAAISGTALTLNKVASGSSTSTLSFYTPHGIVVGGGNNQATGSYSFIGGGGDAGTAANRNVASGDWSFVGGGTKNVASGISAVVAGGGVQSSSTISGNTASGNFSFIGSGYLNQATGNGSIVLGGIGQQAGSTLSSVIGGSYGSTRGIIGYTVLPASFAPISNSPTGVSQSAILVIGKQTTDATPSALTSEGNAASTSNQVILPNNSAYTFKGTLIANVTGGGDTSSWEFRGAIKRGAGVGTTALVGTPRIDNIGYDTGATLWTFTLTADTTNGGLAITVTGAASTTIRWVAKVETTEVTY